MLATHGIRTCFPQFILHMPATAMARATAITTGTERMSYYILVYDEEGKFLIWLAEREFVVRTCLLANPNPNNNNKDRENVILHLGL